MSRPIQYKGLKRMKTRVRSSLVSGLALSSLAGCGLFQSEIDATALRPPSLMQPVVVKEEASNPARTVIAPARAPAEPVRAITPEGLPIFQVATDPRVPRPLPPALPQSAAVRASAVPSPLDAVPAITAMALDKNAGPSTSSGTTEAARAVPPPAPAHDFPWIPGALHVRAQEETTFGVGSRMIGRLFARVDFGGSTSSRVAPSALLAIERPQSKGLAASAGPRENAPDAAVSCMGVTCLDAARDSLLFDAERKGWKVMLNRRIALQQSFMFQREDRMVWVEVKSSGASALDLEYGLIPVQGGQK
jgi:hypothetical protein